MSKKPPAIRTRLRLHRAASNRPGGGAGRQAQKSASTRKVIVEAAINCLLKYGYAQTTTPRIADEAGLSRGAMMHHFSNRITVIQAAIEHLHAKRLRAFRRAVAALPQGQTRREDALTAYWRQVRHPLFVAFHELSVAARTDAELDAILRPAKDAFNREWYRLAVDLFPEWQLDRERFDLALALTQNLLEGMAVSRLNGALDDETEARLLAHLDEELSRLAPRAAMARAETAV